MQRISNKTKDALNAIPLVEVMKKHGYRPRRKDGKGYWFVCPFHKETEPSFHILTKQVGELQVWHCHGCGKGSKGAIDLEMALEGLTDKKESFPTVCKQLGKMFNIPIIYICDDNRNETDFGNGFFHRAKEVEAQDSISFKFRNMTMAACEAIGCETKDVYGDNGERIGETHSWGDGFTPDMLERDFCVRDVDNMTLPKRMKEKESMYVSWNVKGTEHYPILAFGCADTDGVRYWKLYEPLYLKTDDTKEAGRSKFYYYPEKQGDTYNIKGDLWGDAEFMEAWRSGEVKRKQPSSSADGEDGLAATLSMNKILKHPIVRVEGDKEGDGEDAEKVWKFERLLICSGPRDGINAYYYSTAHVCWLASESAILTVPMIQRLRTIAKEIFICYDTDKTGVNSMNHIALRYLDIRVVYLPTDLSNVRDPRTKKPCKDLSDYLRYYPTPDDQNKREAFEGLLCNAVTMRFWRVIGSRRNVDGERKYEAKYELQVDAVAQYAQARGFYLYQPKLYGEDGQLGQFFFRVKDNVSTMIESKDVVQEIKLDMLSYLSEHYHYSNQSLRNAVITSRRLIPDTMFALSKQDTSFISWGKDFCYFFFRNTAVMVTGNKMLPVRYSDLPFFVNKMAIINYDFDWSGEEFFDIEYDEKTVAKLQEAKDEHLKILKQKDMLTQQSEQIENERYAKQERLWRYRLVLKGRAMNEMPPAFQVVYDAGRIYWKKEKAGLALTAEEKQRQDMYFISKCLSIGYMLHPFRDPTRIYAVVSTDYNGEAGKAQGRNMKSFVGGQLLPLVRRGLMIGGKNINTKPDKFAENFANYELTEHSYLYLDDLKTQLDVETLFNSGNIISKRRLYHDPVQIRGQWVPKIMMSTNNPKVFDMSSASQYERIWMQPHSDYYHAEDERGQYPAFNPMIKFGRNIIEEMTDEERQATMWWLMKCCQLYIRENRDHFEHAIVRVDPDSKKQQERLEDLIRDNDMILFFQNYFEDNRHFRRPISRKELMLQFELFKLQRNEGVVLDHTIGIRRESLSAASVARFGKCLRAYCENLPYEQRIVINPESLFKDEQRWKSEGVVSRHAWVSVLDERHSENMVGYNPTRLRERREKERCYYFYYIKDVPQDKEEVWGCGETDPEAEGGTTEGDE